MKSIFPPYKLVRLAIFLSMFLMEMSDSNAQLSVFPRYYHFGGDMGKAFNNAIGGGLSYCNELGNSQKFEFKSFCSGSLSKVFTVADSLPTETYANDTLIEGSWESYKGVSLFSFDINGLVFLSNDKHWKPFAGFEVSFQYFNYNYEHYIPNVIFLKEYNSFMVGFSIGPTIGTYYFFNDKIGVMAKAAQSIGWVFQEGPVRVNYNAFDITAGVSFLF